MARHIDMVGQVYSALTVVKRAEGRKFNSALWVCKCECGNLKVTSRARLTSGYVKSCGCGAQSKKIKHRMSNSPEHRIWRGLIGRCTNPLNKRYSYYGGRGISVCQSWKDSFMAFINDMGARPSHIHSIDRIDVNGDYEPNNCKWSTAKEQARNRRSSVKHTFNGLSMTLPEWADYLQVPEITLRKRLKKGHSPEEIFSDRNIRYGSIVQSKRRLLNHSKA